MRLETPYKSISQFDDVELEDFSVLTGGNGSGKTHILEAIRDGAIRVDGIRQEEILHFDLQNFYAPPEPKTKDKKNQSRSNLTADQKNEENQRYIQFHTMRDQCIETREHLANEVLSTIEDMEQRKRVEKLVSDFHKEFSNQNIQNLNAYFSEKNEPYREKMGIKDPKIVDPDVAKAQQALGLDKWGTLYTLSIQRRKKITELDPGDQEALNPYITQIAELQVAWLKKRYGRIEQVILREWDKEEPKFEIADKLKGYENSPVEEFNKTLDHYNFNSYRCEVSKKKVRALNYNEFSREDLNLKIIDLEKPGLEIDWHDLSSGEQILMAISVLTFKHSRSTLPKLMLLDEIDAVLHPSNTKSVMTIFKERFVEHSGIKVIMATHSPTTVASSETIYVVEYGNQPKKIRKAINNDALTILTAGYVTVHDTLEFLSDTDDEKLYILTEGYNNQYIQKSIEYLAPEIESRVCVVTGIEDKSGQRQLKTFYELICRLNLPTPMLFVWDPDVGFAGSLSETEMVRSFKFDASEYANVTDVGTGIESLFPPHLISDEEALFTPKKIKSGGRSLIPDKNKIRKHILSNGQSEDYSNFAGLIGRIKSILDE